MKPATAHLRRALSVVLALTPLLAGADLCTVGALTGRSDLACGMERAVAAPAVERAATPACPYCHPAAAPQPTRLPRGTTCCDLRPAAAAAATPPELSAPVTPAPAAVAGIAAAPEPPADASSRVARDAGRAPPGAPPSLHSSRAPPLG